MIKILLMIMLVIFSTEIYSNPYDQCLYILEQGGFKAEISYDTTNKKQIMKNYLCSQDIVSDKDTRKSKFVFASLVVGVFSDASAYERDKLANMED